MHRLHKNNFKLNVNDSAAVVVRCWRFLLYTCVCARVRSEKFVLFPELDAVKRQEMPNLPLFSVSDGFKLENGIVVG